MKIKTFTLIASVAALPLLAGAIVVEVNTSTQQSSGFSDGTINPFTVCTTQSPNYCQAFTKNGLPCVKSYWEESAYNGTRDTKGAECCSSFATYSDGWYGFYFYLPDPGFPKNKTATIAQIFQDGACNSWAGMLVVTNGNLALFWRDACVSPTVTILGSITYNSWEPFIIHFRPSDNDHGEIQIWYGSSACANQSAPTFVVKNINFGFGTWANGTTLASGNELVLKFGQYDWDTGNYTSGETRINYFSNVCQIVGNPGNAWTTANPTIN